MIRYLEVTPGRAELLTGERQTCDPGWTRVQVAACGVCATDLHLFHGMELPRGIEYPVRPGHEVSGVVLEAPGAEHLTGAQVVLHPIIPCGVCAPCQHGRENRCRGAGSLGIDYPGGFADEVYWPAGRLVDVSGIDLYQAAILPDAVATAYHAIGVARIPEGGRLSVVGGGGVGTNLMKLARALYPAITITAIVHSAATAERIKSVALADRVFVGLKGSGKRVMTEVGPQDAVIEFGAGAAAVREGLMMLTRGGRFVFGSISAELVELGTSVTTIVTRELQIRGSYASTLADLRAVVAIARSGVLDLSTSVSHTFPLDQVLDAIRLVEARPKDLTRVIVRP